MFLTKYYKHLNIQKKMKLAPGQYLAKHCFSFGGFLFFEPFFCCHNVTCTFMPNSLWLI